MLSLISIPLELQLAIFANLVELFPLPPPPPRHPRSGAPPGPDPKPTWMDDTLERFAALGSLARTCRTLQQLTAPMLFERVKVSIFRPVYFVQLIRHLSRVGHHATFVKHLTIGSAWDTSILSAPQAAFLLQEGRRLGLKSLPDSLNSSSDWAQAESISVLIEVLLCQVLAIRKLVLSISRYLHPHKPFDAQSAVVSYAARLPDSLTFHSLRDIEAHSRHRYMYVDGPDRPSLTALLNHAPAVARLEVGYCDGTAPQGLIQNPLPELQDLRLFEGFAVDLAAAAEFCPRLQRCRLDAGVLETPSTGLYNATAWWDRESPLNALLPLSTSLEDLDIDGSGLAISDMKYIPHMAPFCGFRSLRWTFCSRWPGGDNTGLIDKLPLSIESLCLGGPDMPVHDIATLLCERIRNGQLRRLKSFRYMLLHQRLEAGVAESTAALFEGLGVDCGLAVLDDACDCCYRPPM